MDIPTFFLATKYASAMLVVGVGGVVISGFFPSRSRPAALRDDLSNVMIGILLLALITLLGIALWLGLTKLSWPISVVAGGLALLGAPFAFQLIPARFWDSRIGILAAILITSLALSALLLTHT